MLNNEPFEVRKILFRYKFSATENSYDVEVYFPEKFHSTCYHMVGQDEADVYAQLMRRT